MYVLGCFGEKQGFGELSGALHFTVYLRFPSLGIVIYDVCIADLMPGDHFKLRFVQRNHTVVQKDMMLGTNTNDILHYIGALMAVTQRLQVVSFGVELAIRQSYGLSAKLAPISVKVLYPF